MVSALISHSTWGRWPSVRLSTAAVAIEVVSELGARVVSLRDLRRDREWLMQGEAPTESEAAAWAREDAAFWGRQSFGWDECLPTVSVCADPLSPGGPPLRDHGDQWARGAHLSVDVERGAVEHAWSAPRWAYRLTRRLSFEDERTLLAAYRLESLADEPLPVLWSQHPVFQLEPGTRIELPGVGRMVRTWQHDIDLGDEPAWPASTTLSGVAVDLSRVQTGQGWAVKLYADAREPIHAVAPDGARLTLDWDRAFAPVLGVWLAYGGWPPQGAPCEQVALEPTTSSDDSLEAALRSDRARVVEPGAQLAWWVTLGLGG